MTQCSTPGNGSLLLLLLVLFRFLFLLPNITSIKYLTIAGGGRGNLVNVEVPVCAFMSHAFVMHATLAPATGRADVGLRVL